MEVIFHTDAAQSAAKIDTDVSKLGVGLLSIAGHKLYAPKGIGALYLKKGINIKNIMYGASQEKGLRPGTENVIHIVALGKACEIAKRDFDRNYHTMLMSRDRLLNGLRSKPGIEFEINGDLSNSLPNTISIAFNGVDAHTLASLIGNEIYISTGSACHADSIEISPVLKAMEINLKVAAGTVRISTGRYTTNDEIDIAIEIITKTVIKLQTR
ncbi:MAG: cysteine desulfurase family protein [Bacteroidales bacterium]